LVEFILLSCLLMDYYYKWKYFKTFSTYYMLHVGTQYVYKAIDV
jgi:hypothetical protein